MAMARWSNVLVLVLLLGHVSAQSPPSPTESLQRLAESIFLPLLTGAKLAQSPNIPPLKSCGVNVLELITTVSKDIVPCLAPCLLAQADRLYDGIVYLNDSYGQCFGNFSMTFIDDGVDLTDPSSFWVYTYSNEVHFSTLPYFCPAINTSLDCVLREVEAQCGSGLSALVRDQLVPPILRLFECVDDPAVATVNAFANIHDNENQIRSCIYGTQTLNTVLYTLRDWRSVYTEEVSSSSSSLLCSLVEDLNCTAPQASENFYQVTVYDNIGVIRQYLNCDDTTNSPAGSEVLACFGDPTSYESCLQRFLSQLRLPPTSSLIEVFQELMNPGSCGHFEELVSCTKNASRVAGCDPLLPGLDHVLGPLLYAHNDMCGRNSIALSDRERNSIETCRCLNGFSQSVPTLGACGGFPGTVLEQLPPAQPFAFEAFNATDYFVILTVLQPWEDRFVQFTGCTNAFVFSVVCQRVQFDLATTLGRSLDYIGVVPTPADMSAVLFKVTLENFSQFTTTSAAVTDFVSSGALGIVPVSRNATVISSTELQLSVQPVSGPQAGGTLVTVTGSFTGLPTVFIGDQECQRNVFNRVLIICMAPELGDSSQVRVGQTVSIQYGAPDFNQSISQPTGYQYTYLPDTIITNLQPLRSPVSGGVLVTVSGENLNVASVRLMITTITGIQSGITDVIETTCFGDSPLMMFCRTPPLDVERYRAKRRRRSPQRTRRQTGTECRRVNDLWSLTIATCIVLDGKKDYLNGTALEKMNTLNYYCNPTFEPFDPFTRTFTPIAPVKDTLLEIKGMNLLRGLQQSDYAVKIGVADCMNINVLANLIICEPPPRQPEVAAGSSTGNDRVPIVASFLNNQATIGNLQYVQTPWQHLPTRYGIVGGLVGAVVILGVAIACICRCLTNRNKRGTEEGRRLVPQGRGPLRGVPRFLPFIPAGLRGKPNAGRAAVFEANRAIAPVRGTTWAAPAL